GASTGSGAREPGADSGEGSGTGGSCAAGASGVVTPEAAFGVPPGNGGTAPPMSCPHDGQNMLSGRTASPQKRHCVLILSNSPAHVTSAAAVATTATVYPRRVRPCPGIPRPRH